MGKCITLSNRFDNEEARDGRQAQVLLHGNVSEVFGDASYQGSEKREENLKCPVKVHIALRPV